MVRSIGLLEGGHPIRFDFPNRRMNILVVEVGLAGAGKPGGWLALSETRDQREPAAF